MKIIYNKKGAALLWCILLTVILTILLGSITTACYAYFNYTMYTVKRQQAYFTARSAINVVLENLSSVEQAKETDVTDTATSGSYSLNFDGTYLKDVNSDGIVDVVNGDNSVKYYGTNVSHDTFTSAYTSNKIYFDDQGYLIEDYTLKEWSWKEFKTIYTNVKVRTRLVKRAVSSTGSSYTSSSNEIDLLPAANSTITVSDFGFDNNMGKASATISRDDNDQITIKITSYYPDENGEKYEMQATVVRQPVYFGGVAVRELELNANLTLGDSTDFYWNNTDEFNTNGNSTGSLTNNGYKFYVTGNLVTKGNATITAGNVFAGKKFYGTASFTNDDKKQKKIWNPSQYIISNKSLVVGDSGVDYSSSTVNTIAQILEGNVTYKYTNSRGSNNAFGGLASEAVNKTGLDDLLKLVGLEDAYEGVNNNNYALTNDDDDAMAIQYIEILSLSSSIDSYLIEKQQGDSLITAILSSVAQQAYDAIFKSFKYDTLDVSYIDFSSTDENNRADEVVPLTYLKIPSNVSVRVRYGCDPGNRTKLGAAIEGIGDDVESFLAKVFDINSNAAYNVVYMSDSSTIELGWDGDNKRSIKTYKDGKEISNQAANIFYYSIYGGDDTTVVLYDDVIVVGEIICEKIVLKGDAKVVYSSTNGSQVAKQKVAEYWTVSNYSD